MEKLNLESLEEIANRTNSENDARRELDRVGRVIYSEARRRNYSLGGLMGIYERLHNLIDARLPLRQRPPRRLPREFELDIETIAKEIVDAVKKGQIALGDAEELQRDFFKLVGPELRSFSPDKFFDKTNRGLELLRFLPAGSSANNEVSKKNDFRTATARSGFMEGMRRLDDTVNGRQDAQATSNKKESKLIPEFSRFIEGMKNLNDRLEFERLQKNRIQPTDTTGRLQSSESEMNPDDIGIEVGAMPNYGRFERASEGGFEKDETAAPRSSDKSAKTPIAPSRSKLPLPANNAEESKNDMVAPPQSNQFTGSSGEVCIRKWLDKEKKPRCAQKKIGERSSARHELAAKDCQNGLEICEQ